MTAVSILDAWEPVRAARVRGVGQRAHGAQPRGPQHEWVGDRHGDTWCTKCLRHKRDVDTRERGACVEAPAVVRAAPKAGLGHSIIAAAIEGSEAVLAHCTKCGGFAVSSMRLLGQTCRPRAPADQPARKAIADGKHPKTGARLGATWAVRAWREAARAPDDA